MLSKYIELDPNEREEEFENKPFKWSDESRKYCGKTYTYDCETKKWGDD